MARDGKKKRKEAKRAGGDKDHKKKKEKLSKKKHKKKHKAHAADAERAPAGGNGANSAPESSSSPSSDEPLVPPARWYPGPAPGSAVEPGESVLAELLHAYPDGMADLAGLCAAVAQGQPVALGEMEDGRLRGFLERLFRSLGLRAQTRRGGVGAEEEEEEEVFEAETEAQRGALRRLLGLDEPQGALAQTGSPEGGSPDREAGPTAPDRDRVIGPQLPQATFEPSIGPALAAYDGERLPNDGEDDDDADGDGDVVVGPRIPIEGEVQAAPAWWQQEEALKGPSPWEWPPPVGRPEERGTAPRAREEWLTTLPKDRHHNFAPDVARTFTRQGLTELGDQSVWTDTPADRERKRSRAQGPAGVQGVARPQGSPRGRPGAADQVQTTAPTLAAPGDYERRVKPQSLLEAHREARAGEATAAHRDGRGAGGWDPTSAPWRPFDREKDLDIRRTDPQGLDQTLNDRVLGSLSTRFGSKGSVQRSFL